MDELQVTIAGDVVGRLTRDPERRIEFTYDTDWLDRPGATPLSVSLPLRSGAYGKDRLLPYLWGLLPDNELVLERWARDYQCSATDVFALLANVGTDVAGAAQYLPSGVVPEEADAPSYDPVDEEQVADLLRAVQADGAAWHPNAASGRWSLAGAQSKIALAFDTATGWSVPHGQAPTTHILKPAIRGLSGHDLNEHLTVRAAGKLGLLVEETTIGHFAGQRALVAKRYDRVERDGAIVRVHQEDLCQALGVHPARKYQNDGGPSFEDMARLLREVDARADGTDVARLSDALAYNWLVLGTDAHAKNYSLLLSGAQVRFAPLYDLASVAPSAPHPPKAKLAQKIGGEYRAGRISDRHWRRLAASIDVDPDGLIRRIDGLAADLPDALADAIAETDLSDDERAEATAMADQVASWAAWCRKQLDPVPASEPPPSPAPRARRPAGTPGGGRFAPDGPVSPAGDDPTAS